MKNTVFWDVTPCGSCKNPSQRASVVLSSLIPFTLMMEAIRFLQDPHDVTSQITAVFKFIRTVVMRTTFIYFGTLTNDHNYLRANILRPCHTSDPLTKH
jgi:hypothetical protein